MYTLKFELIQSLGMAADCLSILVVILYRLYYILVIEFSVKKFFITAGQTQVGNNKKQRLFHLCKNMHSCLQ